MGKRSNLKFCKVMKKFFKSAIMWVGIEEQGTTNVYYYQFREDDTISDLLELLRKEHNLEGRLYHFNIANIKENDKLSKFKEELEKHNFKFSVHRN